MKTLSFSLVLASWIVWPAIIFGQDLTRTTQLPLLTGGTGVPTSRQHEISGVIRDSLGKPLGGVDVAVLVPHPTGHGSRIGAKAKSDQEGRYSLTFSAPSYPDSRLSIGGVGTVSFQVSMVDKSNDHPLWFGWPLNSADIPDSIDFQFPAMTWAKVIVKTEATETVLGNVELFVVSDCKELNDDRKEGQGAITFKGIVRSDVHGTALVAVPTGRIAFGYNAQKAFEGCNQHDSTLAATFPIALTPQSESTPWVVPRAFHTRYRSEVGVGASARTPAYQFETVDGETCEVEIQIPGEHIGQDPFGNR